jgi:hypothetical protein
LLAAIFGITLISSCAGTAREDTGNGAVHSALPGPTDQLVIYRSPTEGIIL